MGKLIGLAVGIIAAYLCAIFITLEPDFRLWSMDARFNAALLALAFGVIGALIGGHDNNDDTGGA